MEVVQFSGIVWKKCDSSGERDGSCDFMFTGESSQIQKPQKVSIVGLIDTILEKVKAKKETN